MILHDTFCFVVSVPVLLLVGSLRALCVLFMPLLSLAVFVGVTGSVWVRPMSHVAVKTGSSGRKRFLMLNQRIVSFELQI